LLHRGAVCPDGRGATSTIFSTRQQQRICIDSVESLRESPEMGVKIVKIGSYIFRVVIVGNYRIIHYTSKESIYISTICDYRRNPKALIISRPLKSRRITTKRHTLPVPCHIGILNYIYIAVSLLGIPFLLYGYRQKNNIFFIHNIIVENDFNLCN
jgi:hypothetical protein